jgi:hypothetical protein
LLLSIGPAAIADAIKDMGAMSKLNLSKNGIITRQAGKALAEMLKANSALTELNISNCADYTSGSDGPGFAQELAVGISGNGAMTSLNLASNKLGVEGAKIIAACIPKCT